MYAMENREENSDDIEVISSEEPHSPTDNDVEEEEAEAQALTTSWISIADRAQAKSYWIVSDVGDYGGKLVKSVRRPPGAMAIRIDDPNQINGRAWRRLQSLIVVDHRTDFRQQEGYRKWVVSFLKKGDDNPPRRKYTKLRDLLELDGGRDAIRAYGEYLIMDRRKRYDHLLENSREFRLIMDS